MSKTFLIAVLAGAAMAVATTPAAACQSGCGHRPHHPPVVQQFETVEVEPLHRPPHYVVEHGPLYDGLSARSAPRVYAPRVASAHYPQVYGYGVGFSGGPVAVSYRYVSRVHRTRRPPLRVYY